MRTLRGWLSRMAGWFDKQRREREFQAELEFHLQMHIEDNLRAGLDPAEARRQALVHLGGIESTKEAYRDQSRPRWLEDLVQDLQFGLRLLAKSPGFTAVAVGSLALGIGGNTAMFSLVETLVLRQLPVREPLELVKITNVKNGDPQSYFNTLTLEALREHKDLFTHVFSWQGRRLELGFGQDMKWVTAQLVSEEYFAGLGLTASRGRLLGDERAEPRVAVVSFGYWQDQMRGDPAAVGRNVPMGGTTFTIVGVLPPDFHGVEIGQAPAVWMPLEAEPILNPGSKMLKMRNASWIRILARLRAGRTREETEAAFRVIWPRLLAETGPADRQGQLIEPFRGGVGALAPAARGTSAFREEFQKPLVALSVAVGLVLLITCVNLANLLAARGQARQREFAVRLALGAGRGRLLRQMLTESLLLGLLGAAAGMLFARVSIGVLLRLLSVQTRPAAFDVRPNARVMLFALCLTVLTVLLFGLAPALGAVRHSLAARIKERHATARSILALQVALSLLLVAGAGLFLRTLRNLVTLDMGYQPEHVLLVNVQPGKAGIRGNDAARFYRELRSRIEQIPGVRAAGYSMMTQMRHCCLWERAHIEGVTLKPSDEISTFINSVSPGYFAAMGTQLLQGRDFGQQDQAKTPPVAIINQRLARQFPVGQAIGRFLLVFGQRREIVAVVQDSHFRDLRTPVPYAAYFPIAQEDQAPSDVTFEVGTLGQPLTLIQSVRRIVHGFGPSIAVDTTTLAEEVNETLINERILALLWTFFAGSALLLASIGLYGTVSHATSRRTAEIGIRMALGATVNQVLWLVMRDCVALITVGVVAGVAAVLVSGRWIASLLYGVDPADPWALSGAVAVLAFVTLLAAFGPARKASRIEPLTALRYE